MNEAAIWAALPVPGLVLDGQDRILRLNPAAEGFLMQSARALAGRVLWQVMPLPADLQGAFARARRLDAPLFINDVRIGGHEGGECNLQLAPLEKGEMILLVSPRDLAGWVQGSSAKSAAKSAIGMSEMLAHEIKNPLAGITGAAQLLSMNLNGEDRELTDLIVAESRRIVALLEQVEQFGNVMRPALAAVNIHDVLDRARRSALVGFARHMRIVRDYDPSLPLARADADQLLQVVLNLLKNAAEAAEGGTIRLHTFYDQALRRRGEDGVGHALPLQIEVIDDGPGLPPEIAGEVFDPFVSGRENGTGLGLALAAKIISENEGWISVRSEPGHTVFRISLPRAMKEDG